GVGLKTITVTLLEAWGADLCPVDTHVHRVIQRLQCVDATSSRDKTYHLLAAILPEGSGFALHHNLLTFGRTICKAKAPKCGECFLAKLCPSRGVV
ncbi:MAG: endonuclease III, partial [Planctomycetes bacterium]|nr:endonuclease III [Planctomycetota bacterium]